MIPVSEPVVADREVELVRDAVSSGWVSPEGSYVETFELNFAQFVGTDHAIATSTGTAALHLSLASMGIGAGDEVILPTLTWAGCANAVRYVDATPVFVDVDPEKLTMDIKAVEGALTERTAAIMPVHLYGNPCALDPILELATENGIRVIEDSAEAHGATYDGSGVGSIGDVGCFSFYGNKILTTGQGGMITTDDDELAARMRLLRRDGMSSEEKYVHEAIGYNYRLTNLQAALGVAQLERVSEILEDKCRVSALYDEHLPKGTKMIVEPADGTSVRWMIVPQFPSEATRDAVAAALSAESIETRPVFYPLDRQEIYREWATTTCPVAATAHRRRLVLPSAPTLTGSQIEHICSIMDTAIARVR